MYNLCVVYIGDFMKKPYIFITLFLITALFCSLISSIGTKVTESVNKDVVPQYTVVIDAGHGGKDVGTVGIDGTNEKDINLAIALRLYDYLMVSGYDALLIRKDDTEFYEKGEGRTRSDLYNRLMLIRYKTVCWYQFTKTILKTKQNGEHKYGTPQIQKKVRLWLIQF